MATEQLHFSYSSIGNLAKLLVSIQWEKTKSVRDINVFHQRFDRERDELFEEFLYKLYPDGATIGEEEIKALVNYIADFMRTDPQSIDLYVAWDKRHWSSWVYFKQKNKVYNANMGCHTDIVRNICIEFFKGCYDIDSSYLKQFILDNFEIKSDFTTVEIVAGNASYIAEHIR